MKHFPDKIPRIILFLLNLGKDVCYEMGIDVVL